MAMGPIDYTAALGQSDLLQNIGQGVQFGANLQDLQIKQKQQAMALQQAQQYQQDAAMALKSPTPQAFATLALKYPQHREAFKQGWEQLSTAQQQSEIKDGATLAAALQSGRSDVALGQIDSRIKAMDNSGQDTGTLKFLRQQVEADPQKAYGTVLHVLSGLPGGDKVLENLGKVGTEARAASKAPAELRTAEAGANEAEAKAKTAGVTADFARPQAQADLDQKAAQLGLTRAEVRNINSQIGNRAAQLNLDGQKLDLEVQKFLFDKQQKLQDIGQDGRKLVNDSAVASGAAKLSAERANDLAGRLETLDGFTGATGDFAEWLKKATGNQDAFSELRSQYTALRNSEGAKNLPPGPASDKDVALALEGIPPATANPKVMQSWLKGVAKLNDINAAVENARADYAASNKGLLGRAKTNFQAGGTDVVAGDSWVQISKRVAEAAARKYTPEADRVNPAPGSAYIPGSGTPEAQNQAAQRNGTKPRSVSFNQLPDN